MKAARWAEDTPPEGIPYEWPSGHRLAGRPRPSRRLVVAGVIRRGEMDPPGTRAVAITADWGHPRGPIAGKVIWDVEADAAGSAPP